jgi:hypothetical protein
MKSSRVRTPITASNPTDPKKETTTQANQPTEINASHSRQAIEKEQEGLAQRIEQTSTAIKNTTDNAKGDQLFRDLLIRDTNTLVARARQAAQIQVTPYSKQFSSALARLNLQKNDSTGLLEAQFKEIKKLIDNSSVILAFPHNVTQFKAGAIYNAYREKRLDTTMTNLIIASLDEQMPDDFKRFTGDNGTRPATPLEIGAQCWNSIYTSLNKQDINRFEFSCQNVLNAREIPDQETARLVQQLNDLRLEPKALIDDLDLDDLLHDPYPSPPSEAPCDEKPTIDSQNEKPKTLYVPFNSDLIHRLIPETNRATFEELNSNLDTYHCFPLKTYMQKCLPKKSVSNIQDRQNRLEFFFKVEDELGLSIRAYKDEVQGKIFDPSLGIPMYASKPENFIEKISELKKKYNEKSTIDPCQLNNSELLQSFFKYANAKIDSLCESEKKQLKKQNERKGIIERVLNSNVIQFELNRNLGDIKTRCENDKSELKKWEELIEENGLDKINLCFTDQKTTYSLQYTSYQTYTSNRFENSHVFFTDKNLNDPTQQSNEETYRNSRILSS